MVPRVFVSSTYYDLKYVRERIEKFIESYGFEPILFGSDKVTYQHGKAMDHSAYYEVSLCHIMLLIVGGRYGSPSSQVKVEEERKKYDDDYISITRKEFETASEKNMPIFIFIDKNVYGEFQTYKENQDYFDDLYLSKPKDNNKFKFAHVDHVNVFKFIDIIRSKPIKTFEKVEEIEYHIKSQLSGMFYLYLESLKKKSEDNKILDTIAELNSVTLRMNEMLTSVGKEILGHDKEEYEKVIESQLEIMLDFFGDKFSSSIEFESELSEEEFKSIDLNAVAKIIYEETLKKGIPKIVGKTTPIERHKYNHETMRNILTDVQSALSNINNNIVIKKYLFRKLNFDFREKVLPFIKNSSDEALLIDRIEDIIRFKLIELVIY